MGCIEEYRKRRDARLRMRNDEEIWRTSEQGKHYALETETGEITKGNIGQKRIPKVQQITGKMSSDQKYQISSGIEKARRTMEYADKIEDQRSFRRARNRARREFRNEIKKLPEGARIEMWNNGFASTSQYIFEKHGDKFDGWHEHMENWKNEGFKDVKSEDIFNMFCKLKDHRIAVKNGGASEETLNKAKEAAKKNGNNVKVENGNMYVEFPIWDVRKVERKNDKYWGRVVDEPVGNYRGEVGDFAVYSAKAYPTKDDDKFGYEFTFKKW